MAWHARILAVDIVGTASVEVGFYDDALAANVPVPTVFASRRSYSAETSAGALQALVISDGQLVRAGATRNQAVLSALPVGRDITIP